MTDFIDEIIWSAPDADGIKTQSLDVGAQKTLRGRRKRRAFEVDEKAIELWPEEWRFMLRKWVRSDANRKKWPTLIKDAGHTLYIEAHKLLDALLKNGFVEIEEFRNKGEWEVIWVDFVNYDELREILGLSHRGKQREDWETGFATVFENEHLRYIADSLFGQPIDRSLKRLELLKALDSWISNGRFGTRRDFAFHVRGDTKSISGTEWEWLENGLDLESYGINRHVQALWLKAPLVLKTPSGVLDLRAIQDFIGLTPKTMQYITSVEGCVSSWMVVENRTSFEKVAERFGHDNGVLWVPGFGPSWWGDAVSRLVRLCPAPALVAADPDPAGINIARGVGRIWEEVDLAWQPWCMDITTITSLKHRKPITENDKTILMNLLNENLPDVLTDLASWILKNEEKGEQEGIPTELWVRTET